MPMLFLAAGVVLFATIPGLPSPDPVRYGVVTTHLTEVCVVVSLMGAGLALNRRVGWRRWSSTWRLLGITMPLSIVLIAVAATRWLGLGLAAAVLLAAVLAPTDPVLAGEVQVAEPVDQEEQPGEDEARFALTSEAGLNDGLAFAFTYAALAVSAAAVLDWTVVGRWLAVDVGWRIAAGVGVGVGVGWLLRRLFFTIPVRSLRLAEHAEGFVALAATLVTYGLAELIEGYGFLAVFVCACTLRAGEQAHGYHKVLHQYIEQLERLLTVLILVLLGGAIARGLLSSLQGRDIALVAAFLLVIRPLSGWLGLIRSKTGPQERTVIAFFGVRGIGSLFYIAYALTHGHFDEPERLWAITAAVVAGSVVLHGVTATPFMALLDRNRRRASIRRTGSADQAPQTAV